MALVFAVIFFTTRDHNTPSTSDRTEVRLENGVQIIDVTAKGGYTPSFIKAQADLPTELHITTNGTYDCSSSLRIPALGYESLLKPTGTEIVSVPADRANGVLKGTCAMGMYTFDVAFQ